MKFKIMTGFLALMITMARCDKT